MTDHGTDRDTDTATQSLRQRAAERRKNPAIVVEPVHTCALPESMLYLDGLYAIPPHSRQRFLAWLDSMPMADEIILDRCRICGAEEQMEPPGALGVRRLVMHHDYERHAALRPAEVPIVNVRRAHDDDDDYSLRAAGRRMPPPDEDDY